MRRVLTLLTAMTMAAPAAATAVPPAGPTVAATTPQVGRGERGREQRRRDSRAEQIERTTRTLNIGADGEIDVSNISGDMTVTRGSGNSATVEIVKTARAETADEAKALLGLVTVDIMERGTRAEIKTRYPTEDEIRRRNRRNINVDVDFKIAVPAQARVVLHSISGSLSVRDVSGALLLDSISGSIKLANTGRTASAKTISGDIELADTAVEGTLNGTTISGTVRMKNVTARSLTASTVSGGITIDQVTCERIDGQSVSGDVQFTGDLEPNGRYEFTSHSGSVRVALGGKTGFQLEATSFSGGIHTDLPLTTEGSRRPGRTVRGRFGNGSAILDLTSFSGSITISKR